MERVNRRVVVGLWCIYRHSSLFGFFWARCCRWSVRGRKGGEFVEHENRNHFRFFFFRGWKKKWCSRGWNLFSFSCWPFQIIQAEMDVSITENIGVFFFCYEIIFTIFFFFELLHVLWKCFNFISNLMFLKNLQKFEKMCGLKLMILDIFPGFSRFLKLFLTIIS